MKFAFAVFVLIFGCSTAWSQTANIFPASNSAGIGTQLTIPAGPINALQIHYDLGHKIPTQPAILRLSEGYNPLTIDFGTLGLAHLTDSIYTTLVDSGIDLVLHHNYDGDIVFTNWTGVARPYGGAIRFATTGDTAKRPLSEQLHHDLERMTILGNGNVGIDLPPDHITGLGNPGDQLVIGGGVVGRIAGVEALPGINIYGGNRFEGMLKPVPDTGTFPILWRNISFNDYQDPVTGQSKRFAHMSSSDIAFSDVAGGLIQLNCAPYDSARGLNDKTHNITLNMAGNEGLSLYCWIDSSDMYHHLFDCWRPGWPSDNGLRNVNGLFAHRTPVYIGVGGDVPDFTNFAHVNPDIGDGKTWMLAVDGPVLAKEIFVLDSSWADYVFDPNYQLRPLDEVLNYMKTERHLPEVSPAAALSKTGVPVGRIEEQLTKQLEEAMLYIGQLHDEVRALKAEVEELKTNGGHQ